MKQVVTSSEMKVLDKNTIENHGIPSLVLMERAALAVVEELYNHPFDLTNVLVVCGSGNNGGDGIAIARLLHLAGVRVSVCQLSKTQRMSEDCRNQTMIAYSYQVPFVNNPIYSEYTTIVDAIFGVGLSRTIEGIYKDAIEKINQAPARVMAVDIPSGINADNGQILGCAVQADVTVTFAFIKIGHCLYPGKQYSGITLMKDIGIYEKREELLESHQKRYIFEPDDLKLIPARKTDGNKGTFGKVLVVAGSEGMAGAAILCARSVMRCGAGMAKVITHTSNRIILQQSIPEVMVGTYNNQEDAIEQLNLGLQWADVVVCGCGLGTDALAEYIVSYIIKNTLLPLVLDADALNVLSRHKEWLDECSVDCTITPHLGEMSRLCEKSIKEIKDNLIDTAMTFAKEHKVYCVLKDAVSCIASPDGCVYLNTSGNCGMATAGSGDVLAGIIAGLLAIHVPQSYAAALGTYVHGLAGDKAKEKYGESYMMAGDIIESLGEVFRFRI